MYQRFDDFDRRFAEMDKRFLEADRRSQERFDRIDERLDDMRDLLARRVTPRRGYPRRAVEAARRAAFLIDQPAPQREADEFAG